MSLFLNMVNTYKHLNDTNHTTQWYLDQATDADIDARQAWDITTGNPNVIVAVIDSGIDWEHEDLGLGTDGYENIYTNPGEEAWPNNNPFFGNSNDDDNNGFTDDWRGWNFATMDNDTQAAFIEHGTRVAGILAAKTNNNKGISGIAGGWNNEGAQLLVCKVGGLAGPDPNAVDDAILYAAQSGAKIINMSIDIIASPDIDAAITMAHDVYGCTLIAGSGNDSTTNQYNPLKYPASHPYVIAVGGSNEIDQRGYLSNAGQGLFVTAPGININSTILNDRYLPLDGTSFATPMVSGTVALMLSINPCLTNVQIKDILKNTANKVGGYNYNINSNDPGHSQELGYGRLNSYQAVLMAQSMSSPNLDLCIKDGVNDTGAEPNTITPVMWTSNDIWIRNNDDNGITHQNPEYKTPQTINGVTSTAPNYIYVRIKNKSCVNARTGNTLTINWAKANTSLFWPQHWDGSLFNNNGIVLGAELAPVTLPGIPAGEEHIVKIPWVVPNPNDYLPGTGAGSTNPWHFCLLARIDGSADPMGAFTANPNEMVRNHNNMAWKNLTVVDLETNRTTATVMVGNPSNTERTFTLELQPQEDEVGQLIFEEAEISITMDAVLFNAWEVGGLQLQQIDPSTIKDRMVVTGATATIENIRFEANAMGLLTLDFNFLTEELTEKQDFTYHVIQRDAETNELIGGETYLIQKKNRPVFIADAGEDIHVDYNDVITISAADINEPAIYNWYDQEGELIYQGKDLTVTATIAEEYQLEVIAMNDGFKDYSSVEIEIAPESIVSISPNPATDQVTINYKIKESSSSYLMVMGYYGSQTSYNYLLNNQYRFVSIDTTSYPSGYYTIALICDGVIVDATTLYKQ